MNRTKEISFLEELMREADEQTSGVKGACPDPNILWSLTQSDLAGTPMVQELRRHLVTCITCADLSRRLQAFHDQADAPPTEEMELAFRSSEPRLAKNLHNYLKAQNKQRTEKNHWEWPALPWIRSLSFAGAMAVLAIAVLVAVEYRNRGASERQNASTRAPKADGARPGGGAGRPDSTVLMDGAKGNSSDIYLRNMISVNNGEIKLVVSAVEKQSNTTYRFSGRLYPGDQSGEQVQDGPVVNGMWTNPGTDEGEGPSTLDMTTDLDHPATGAGGRDGAFPNHPMRGVLANGATIVPQAGRAYAIQVTEQ